MPKFYNSHKDLFMSYFEFYRNSYEYASVPPNTDRKIIFFNTIIKALYNDNSFLAFLNYLRDLGGSLLSPEDKVKIKDHTKQLLRKLV